MQTIDNTILCVKASQDWKRHIEQDKRKIQVSKIIPKKGRTVFVRPFFFYIG